MKKLLFGFLAVAVLLAGSVVPSYADWQRGGGWHGGGWHGGWHGGWRAPVVFVGPRFVVAPPALYYPTPYVAALPAVVAAPAPPVYTQSSQYWYYCQNPAGYYPSVPQCPSGWLQVAPQPQ